MYGIGFDTELRTRLKPGRVMACLAQGACLIRGKVRVQKFSPFSSKLSIPQLARQKIS